METASSHIVTMLGGGFISTAKILLGNGDGTFQAPLSATVMDQTPMAVALGDFNGDGKIDIAVTAWNVIEVSLGNGDGSFQAPLKSSINFLMGYHAFVGDVNGDGKLDLAMDDTGNSRVYVAFGNGGGTFSGGFIRGFSGNANSLVVTDLTCDGKADLAVAVGDAVNVYIGGVFTGLYLAATQNDPFTAGQTGNYQIVAGNPFFTDTSGTVSVTDTLPGGLTATAVSGSGWACESGSTVRCTRSDGLIGRRLSADQHDREYPECASSFQGDEPGDGNKRRDDELYQPEYFHRTRPLGFRDRFPEPGRARASRDAHRNGERRRFGRGAVSRRRDSQLGTAPVVGGRASFTTSLLPAGVRSLRATYTGDATHSPATSPATTETVNGSAASDFPTYVKYPTGYGPVALALGDINLDGRPDLITSNRGDNTVSVLLGYPGGGFGPKTDYPAAASSDVLVIADFNGDGVPDVAVSNAVLMGKSDGTLQAPVNFSPSGKAMAAADVNGDGKVDLLTLDSTNTAIKVFFGRGDGGFDTGTPFQTGLVSALATGDFNGDGKADIGYIGSTAVYVQLGNGDGTFQPPAAFPRNSASALVSLDLNGDGDADLVYGSTGGVDVMSGTVTERFRQRLTMPPEPTCRSWQSVM